MELNKLQRYTEEEGNFTLNESSDINIDEITANLLKLGNDEPITFNSSASIKHSTDLSISSTSGDINVSTVGDINLQASGNTNIDIPVGSDFIVKSGNQNLFKINDDGSFFIKNDTADKDFISMSNASSSIKGGTGSLSLGTGSSLLSHISLSGSSDNIQMQKDIWMTNDSELYLNRDLVNAQVIHTKLTSTPTTQRTIELPDADGTIALTSDIPTIPTPTYVAPFLLSLELSSAQGSNGPIVLTNSQFNGSDLSMSGAVITCNTTGYYKVHFTGTMVSGEDERYFWVSFRNSGNTVLLESVDQVARVDAGNSYGSATIAGLIRLTSGSTYHFHWQSGSDGDSATGCALEAEHRTHGMIELYKAD